MTELTANENLSKLTKTASASRALVMTMEII